MKPLIIFGAGDIAELADFYFRRTDDQKVAAFVVDAAFLNGDTLHGRPLLALEEVAKAFPPEAHDAFVAVSYARMNRLRADKVAALREQGYRLASYVSAKATVLTDQIGENCFILEDNTLQPFCRIGNNVTLWSGNHIGHHSVIEDNAFISSHVVVSGGVTIGANSFIGVNCTIVDHIQVAPFTMLGAGCIVQANTDAEGVYSPVGTIEKRRMPSTRLKI